MQSNEKFIKANKKLADCSRYSNLSERIDEFRGKMFEKEIIKMFLDAGVSPVILEQKFCEFFWTTRFQSSYSSRLNVKESQERSGVAPSDFGLYSKEELKFKKNFWEKERLSIEKILLSNLSDKELTEEEKEEISNKIFETMKSQDKKVIATCKAIERYATLSKLGQIKEKLLRKNPQKINFDSMPTEKIDTLYGGKKK